MKYYFALLFPLSTFLSIAKSSKSFIKANSRIDMNRKKSQPKIDRLDSLRGSCSDSLFHETFGPLSNVRFVKEIQVYILVACCL